MSTTRIATDGQVTVSTVLRNAGDVAVVAVPQLYLSDPVAEVTRPVRQLIGFSRVALGAGESATVEFVVNADLFAYTGRDGRRRVDAGDVLLLIAPDAGATAVEAVVRLDGPARVVDHRRVLSTFPASRRLE